jgi:hypothetical protein
MVAYLSEEVEKRECVSKKGLEIVSSQTRIELIHSLTQA